MTTQARRPVHSLNTSAAEVCPETPHPRGNTSLPTSPQPRAPATGETQQGTPSPPRQTVFTLPPVAYPSPAYGAAYSYGPSLPPGVALNAHGKPYELATGRSVYIPSTPIPFIPWHMHHSSISPDFMSQGSSHTRPMNGFVDPTTETPLFSLPRQTQISIRAPADESDDKRSRKGQLHQSGAATRTPTVPSPLQGLDSSSQTYYPSLTRPTLIAGSQQTHPQCLNLTAQNSTGLLVSSGGKQEGGANKSAPIDIPQKRATSFEDHDEYVDYGDDFGFDTDTDTE